MNFHNEKLEKEVWIGLVTVSPEPNSTYYGEFRKAYTNGLALAYDSKEYIKEVQLALNKIGLISEEFEDIESLECRIKNYEIDESLLRLAEYVKKNGEIKFGAFHTC